MFEIVRRLFVDCRRRCRSRRRCGVRPLEKVRFEDGTYGLSLEADLEVFDCENRVHAFCIHIIKQHNKLFVDGDGKFHTKSRDNSIELAVCCPVIVLRCVCRSVCCAIRFIFQI